MYSGKNYKNNISGSESFKIFCTIMFWPGQIRIKVASIFSAAVYIFSGVYCF
jgi:hypothetical protein